MPTLTPAAVERARPRPLKYEISCASLRGFTLRVLPSGKKVYYARHRQGGRDVRVRIGRVEEIEFAAARARAAAVLTGAAELPRPRPRAPARPAPLTFAAFAALYLRRHVNRSVKPKTAVQYRGLITRHLLPALGDLRLDRVTPARVEDLHASLRATPMAANNAVRVLSHMFTKAWDWELLDRTATRPTATVRLYRERKRDRFLTPAERARLEATLREGETLPPGSPGALAWSTTAALRLLALTGMRLGEALGLTWAMVDARHRCLRLPDSKTGQRVVPIGEAVVTLLEQLRARQRSGVPWVLYTRTRGRVRESSLGASWRRIRRRAGLDDVRIHDLRHSAASDAIMSGVPLAVVGKLLGHTTPRTTARYAHIADDVLTRAAEQMTAAITEATEHPAGPPAPTPRRRARKPG